MLIKNNIFPVIRSNLLTRSTRYISALYITGDKAKENYVTLQPYMDFENTLINRKDALQASIEKRGQAQLVENVIAQYANYKKSLNELSSIELERDQVAQELKHVIKENSGDNQQVNRLKEKGKQLRNELRTIREQLYPIEDDFAHTFLSLPNELHANCPSGGVEKILYRSRMTSVENVPVPHLQRSDLIKYISSDRYYLFNEAAAFDVNATYAMASYFARHGNFVQTANPDFVRCVLLEANATPIDHYHQVAEKSLQNKLNAAYLSGGGAFESYLGYFAKLCVYPSLLPLRFVSCGRNYAMRKAALTTAGSLYEALQSNAVQTCVATQTSAEADEQMEELLNLATNFYKALGLHFRIVYADAAELNISESLRAVIEVYSYVEKRYVSVGYVSHYSDFVSKRILFCSRHQKEYCFPHLVGGPVLLTTPLLAALIDSGVPLGERTLLGSTDQADAETRNALNTFRDVFK